uniref:Uncharacterized protein n=1 Tax=Anguilla anguilla TaxID=7936 RepID=A0A0E9RWJ8_ANGAN
MSFSYFVETMKKLFPKYLLNVNIEKYYFSCNTFQCDL